MGFPPGHRELDETQPWLCDIMLHRHTDSHYLVTQLMTHPLSLPQKTNKCNMTNFLKTYNPCFEVFFGHGVSSFPVREDLLSWK